MQVYRITAEEADSINQLNYSRVNTLLIVCDYGDFLGVDPLALEDAAFAAYLTALGGQMLPERLTTVEPTLP